MRSLMLGSIIESISEELNRNIRTIVEVISKENRKMLERSSIDSIVQTDALRSPTRSRISSSRHLPRL